MCNLHRACLSDKLVDDHNTSEQERRHALLKSDPSDRVIGPADPHQRSLKHRIKP